MYRPPNPNRYSPSRTVDERGERDDRHSHQRERSPPRRDRDYDYDRDSRDRVPPPRNYDEDRIPPPRRYDDDRERERVPPPRRYDDDSDRDRAPRGRYDLHEERDWDRGRERDDPRHAHNHHDRNHQDRHDRGHPHPHDTQPSTPSSRDVILLGLDPQLTETDLAGFLRTEYGASLESTKIVRDRSGQSKCFGFAMFASLRDAEAFVYENYPTVAMPALYPHSGPKRVKIDFAGTRGEAGSAPAAATAFPPAVRGHDGTRDIGQPDGTQRVLLLRGLDAGTYAGEISHRMVEEVARMLGKSVREAEGAITRVATIVDRTTEGLWSFAFVELVTPELAAALLPFLLSPQHQPNGFLIAQVPIAASFANPAAFLPTAPGPLGTQYLVRAAPNGGIGSAALDQPEGEWCGYWHQAAGAVETVPRGAPPVPLRGAQAELPEGLKVALGRYAGAGASAQPPVHRATGGFAPIAFGAPSGSSEATPGLVPNAVQPIKIGLSFGAGAAGRKKPPAIPEDGIIPISHKNILGDDDDEKDPGRDSVLLSRTKGAKIIPPTSTSRKIAKNINKWNTKQTELAKPTTKVPHAAPRGASAVNAIAVGVRDPPAAAPSAPSTSTPAASAGASTADDYDYTDTTTFATTGKGACLLCQRQFKTEDILRKHVALSDLHKARIFVFFYAWTTAPSTNLADASIRQAGRKRKEAAGTITDASEDAEPKYRDRAAERREVFKQPEKPKLPPPAYRKGGGVSGFKPIQTGAAGTSASASAPAPPPEVQAPPPPPAPAADHSNVGNKLLAKMGWTAGSGLGASADGRVDPIAVQQFDERVGLGAAKGREAGKWSGPGGWHERKKDMVSETCGQSGRG